MTKKYKCTIDVDESHIKRFDLTFEAEDEEDAEAQALMEVKQNLHDYVFFKALVACCLKLAA